MPRASERLKSFLNEQANVRLTRLGHSPVMMRDAKRAAWWWLTARADAAKRRSRLRAGWVVLWPEAGRADLVPFEVADAGPGEVTVQIAVSAVSPGTERAQYLRLPNADVRFPYRPGYSAAGVVAKVGRGVHHVEPGDAVAVTGAPHASVVTVPASSVYRLPPGVSLEDGALIQLGIITGYGVRRAGLHKGEAVCVVGAGLVGALAQRWAIAAGTGAVTVVAASRSKEAAAKASGAVRFLLASDREAVAELASPVVIEATGDPDAIAIAIAAAAEGGRVVLLGSPRGACHDLDVADVRRKRLRLVGAHVSSLGRADGRGACRRQGEAFLDALAAGTLPVGDLTVSVDPREATAFYRRLARERALVGARFDWTRLRADEANGRARLLRLPDLSARGVDFRKAAISARRSRSAGLLELADPFAGAAGNLRIGLVGCGDIAVRNAAAIAAAPNATLVACYDPARQLADDLAREHGAETASSVERLLERKDVDAVVLCVPHHLHAPLAVQAAEAGKHVLVEKPPARDLAGAVEMTQAAARAGVFLSVCFPDRYQASTVVTRRLLEAGALGEFTGALINYAADKTDAYWRGGFSGRSVSSWRLSREQAGGGVLIMNACHHVDRLRYLVGVEADSLLALVAAVDDALEVEDSITVAVRYANGAVGTIAASSARRGMQTGTTELQLWGRDGHIAVQPAPLKVYTLRAVDRLRTGRWHDLGPLPRRDTRAVYVSRFATAVTRGEEPDVTARDALAVQAFLEAAYRSSETGRAVRPADLLQGVRG